MARRSPMNERYQKNTAPAGKTRKSAAAAKPKRQSAATSSSPAKKSGARSAGSQSRSMMAVNPPTPEFRFWRRVWWAMLLTSLVLAASTYFLYREPSLQRFAQYGLFLSYVLIGGALFLDLTKLRRLRQEWVASGGQPEKPKSATPDGESDGSTASSGSSSDDQS